MHRQISLTLACLLFGLSLLAIGLWPFNFRADNHVDIEKQTKTGPFPVRPAFISDEKFLASCP